MKPLGRIDAVYATHGGGKGFVIAWDDRKPRVLTGVVPTAGLAAGMRVRLDGDRLVKVA